MKKLQLIINPAAGTKQGKRFLAEIIAAFGTGGYLSTVFVTLERGQATRLVKTYGAEYDLIVCVGGDGTFNEVIAGVVSAGLEVPIGYIPAGSTNDFAGSLHLSPDIMQACQDILTGREQCLDVGLFNGRSFSYVASFGAFTKASYATPQSVKNTLGHLAYVLEGIRDIPQIKPWHVKIETGEKRLEGEYIFGAVSNSTSLGGVLTLDPKLVDMNDGLFEIMLIRSPATLNELNAILWALGQKHYDSPMIDFLRTSRAEVYASREMDWSLDGEYEPGCERAEIVNRHNAIRLLVPKTE